MNFKQTKKYPPTTTSKCKQYKKLFNNSQHTNAKYEYCYDMLSLCCCVFILKKIKEIAESFYFRCDLLD